MAGLHRLVAGFRRGGRRSRSQARLPAHSLKKGSAMATRATRTT